MPPRHRKLVNPHNVYTSLEEFLATGLEKRGTMEIIHGGLPLHVFLDWRNAATTLVTFTGTVSRSVEILPIWSASQTTRAVGNVNRLHISDPTLAFSKRLRLGWYAGNQYQPNLEQDVSDIITTFARGSRVLLFGPSAGGFTALVQASKIPGSTVIVSNPQTDISIRPAFPRYLEVAWDRTNHEGLPFTTNVIDIYSEPVDTQLVYIQNQGDHHHIEYHQQPFLEAIHGANKVTCLAPDFGKGHIGPDRDSFIRMFQTARDHSIWEKLLETVHSVELTRIV